ncbi:TMTC1 protein, partial [Polypterus senegalus]
MTARAPGKASLELPVAGSPVPGVYRSLFLVLVCALCYSNSLRGEFVHDDVWAILNNPDVRPGSSLANIFLNDFWGKRMADNSSHKSYRPLCILTFKLNILVCGMTPMSFHAVNLLLHCAVTVLLMYICEKTVFDDNILAFLTALLFAVHPIHTEAVSGIVGRADVLACLLFLMTFLCYIRLYPRHASALNNLGTLTKDPVEAEQYYRQALHINLQHNRALFNLGNLLKSKGKEEEAEQLLRSSIQHGPHFADAYSSLASLLAEQGHFEEANLVYLQGIKSCPENSDLHNNYGVFLVDIGDGDQAAKHYQQAIRLKPSHYVAMVNLGRLLRSSDQNKDAEAWYKRALQITRKVEILTPLGALYYNTGQYKEALQVYREAVALQPDNSEIGLALAQVLAMSGKTKEAEKMTQDIISKNKDCIECYRLLSAVYNKRESHSEALEALEKAILVNHKDTKVKAELYFSKGNQLREMNLLDLAFESYKLAVELNPDQSQAWMNMGGIQHIKGDYDSARTYYEKALQLTPGSKLLKENLAKLDRIQRRIQRNKVEKHPLA